MFHSTYRIPSLAEAEPVNCQIDNLRLFPSFLNEKKALVHGYFTMSICYSYRGGDGERSYQVFKREKCLAEIVPLTREKEEPMDIAGPDVLLEILPTEPWRCWAEVAVPPKEREWGLLALAAALFHPHPGNLIVGITGTISVAIFMKEKKVLSLRETPSQALSGEEPPATSPQPNDWKPLCVPSAAEGKPPLPPPEDPGALGKTTNTVERVGEMVPPLFTGCELFSTKKVGDIPTIPGQGKVEGRYCQPGRPKFETKSWPDYTKIYPPPSKPNNRLGEDIRSHRRQQS